MTEPKSLHDVALDLEREIVEIFRAEPRTMDGHPFIKSEHLGRDGDFIHTFKVRHGGPKSSWAGMGYKGTIVTTGPDYSGRTKDEISGTVSVMPPEWSLEDKAKAEGFSDALLRYMGSLSRIRDSMATAGHKPVSELILDRGYLAGIKVTTSFEDPSGIVDLFRVYAEEKRERK